jgi:hypothetical protein
MNFIVCFRFTYLIITWWVTGYRVILVLGIHLSHSAPQRQHSAPQLPHSLHHTMTRRSTHHRPHSRQWRRHSLTLRTLSSSAASPQHRHRPNQLLVTPPQSPPRHLCSHHQYPRSAPTLAVPVMVVPVRHLVASGHLQQVKMGGRRFRDTNASPT